MTVSPFEDFPLLTIFIIVVVVIFLFSLFSPKRQISQRLNDLQRSLPPQGQTSRQKICSQCGAAHPSYAAFCRHCGTRI